MTVLEQQTGDIVASSGPQKPQRCAAPGCRHILKAKRPEAKYCSQRCRQLAARRAHEDKAARAARIAKKRLASKKAKSIMRVCEYCGVEFKTTVAAAKKRYCSAAHRQAAYQQRRQTLIGELVAIAASQRYEPKTVKKHIQHWPLQKLKMGLQASKSVRA